jgi:spermidine/putrescine transport system substrate-binding protein
MNSKKPRVYAGSFLRTTSSRRRFLQFSAATLSTFALSNCQRNQPGAESTASGTQSIAQVDNSEPLYIYTWPDYINEDLQNRFTEQTGIKVVADTYDANETMLAKVQAGGGTQYSILYPSDYAVREMVGLNLLAKLDHSRLQGLDQLLDRWKSPVYDPDNAHSIPLSIGTTGLIYDTNVLNPGPDDWDYLWQNIEQLSGKLILPDDVREVMGATLKSLGYSYNSTNPAEIEAAYNKLVELKPAIADFESFGWEERLLAGDIALVMGFSIVGNALVLDNSELDYVIPSSGTSVWTDTMAIPTSAPNLDAAYAWINFMLEPENSAFAAENLKFATPNQAALAMLPEELTSNTDLFLTPETLAKCEGIVPVDEAIDLYDRYWTQLKSA